MLQPKARRATLAESNLRQLIQAWIRYQIFHSTNADYRIIHSAATAVTHKSQPGTTYHAFAIDIGCYANMRKLEGRFIEIDLSSAEAKEKLRSGPILDEAEFNDLWVQAPADPEAAMLSEESL